MAVTDDGDHTGSLSGGCIEAAVVAEAIAAIKTGENSEVRFGRGSPYIDIRLPCGGSIDLLFTPIGTGDFVAAMLGELRARRPARMHLPREGRAGRTAFAGNNFAFEVTPESVDVTYAPAIRVAILGHGAAVEALERSVAAYGAEAVIFTPDAHIAERAAARGTAAELLDFSSSPPTLGFDRWTAVVFIFHDHDWEPPLIAEALRWPAYYIGAMGNRTAHADRLDRLRDRGVAEEELARIVAPVGLIPSSRDPETLALSVMAQLVADYHKMFMNFARE